jgi:hypothetical protein
MHGACAMVVPVVRSGDGAPAVLKLSWPHPEASAVAGRRCRRQRRRVPRHLGRDRGGVPAPGWLSHRRPAVAFDAMREVSDAFLLSVAGISATLVGLFLVGVFFYIETGPRRGDTQRDAFVRYLRAGTRITLIVFAIPVGLSLALVAMELPYARVLFGVLCILLLAANVDSARRVRGVERVTGSTTMLAMEVVTSMLAVALVITPWVLGGLRPTREDLTWAIVLAFAAGLLSIAATVLSAFDVVRAAPEPEPHVRRPTRSRAARTRR